MPSICKKTHHLKQCVPAVIPKATITPEPATVSAYMNPLKGGLTKINNNNKKKEATPASNSRRETSTTARREID